MASAKDNNLGKAFASAVDEEIGKFRVLQEELALLRNNLQTLHGQHTENDMVLQELGFESSSVYKKVGPVLIKQELAEAKETIQKRLDFINGEQVKLKAKIDEKEKEGNALAVKIQTMQGQLQQITAQAVQAITEQHKGQA